MSGKALVVILLLAGAAGGYYYYEHHMKPPAAAAAAPDPAAMVMPVSVADVLVRDVQQVREYSGRLVAADAVEIRSRVSGPIETVNFKDGALVQKDDLLFTIDPKPYAADVAKAQGALAAAKAALALSETSFKRAKNLINDKAISQSDYDMRQNELNVTRAQVESAQASLDTARLNLDYTQIKAPIAGRVSRPELTVGNLVQAGPNSPLLTTVVSPSPLYADFDIDEQSYLALAPAIAGGDVSKIPVTMELAGGATYQGNVQSFDNKLNPASGTVRVRAVFENTDGTLVPGLFARVHLGSPTTTTSILITDKAVGTDQSKKFVYVVTADNKVEYREVKLGDMSGGLRIITSGLTAGDKIIVNGLQRAHPGAPVKPETIGMEEANAPPQAVAPGMEAAGEKAPADAPAEKKE